MPHTSSQLNHFARFGLVGAAMGAGLLSASILFYGWYDSHANLANEKPNWYDGLSFFPALHGVWSGALIGAINGISAWAMLTRRRVQLLVMAFAGAVLAPTLGTTLYIIHEVLIVPRLGIVRRGGMMQPFGFVETYMFRVLPGSMLVGLFVGLFVGGGRQSHTNSK